jgi:hypothetical protein
MQDGTVFGSKPSIFMCSNPRGFAATLWMRKPGMSKRLLKPSLKPKDVL